MDIVYYFFLAAIVSFFGSCQPGPINMAVMVSSSEKQFRKALYISLGGSVPEAIFAAVAIYASSIIIGYKETLQILSRGFAIAFILIGIYLYLRKAKISMPEQNGSQNGALIGFLISIVNPQVILFWVAVITSMELKGFHLTTLHPVTQFGFLLGSITGAFVLHLLVLWACKKYQESNFITAFSLYSNKIVGFVFAILGISQLLLS